MGRSSKRTTRIQIYLTPSAGGDKPILDLWNACMDTERPQELFRAILRAGLRDLYESGDIPPELVRKARLDRHFRNAPRQTPPIPAGHPAPVIVQLPYAPAGFGHPMPFPAPMPATPPIDEDETVEDRRPEPPSRERERPDPVTFDPVMEDEPGPGDASDGMASNNETDDVLALFGKGRRKA